MAADSWGLSWKGTAGPWLASWASTFIPPPPVVDGMKPAGRRRRHYFVEIDGQTFEVADVQHARAVLDRARDLAAQHAKELAAVIEPARKQGRKPVALPTPQISSPDPELTEVVRQARKSINEVYRSTALEAELAMLLARAMAEEDEEDALLLLM